MTEQTEQLDMSNVPEDTFKKWVKDYRTVDKEVRDAAPLLGALRKRKKMLDEHIVAYMHAHEIASVALGNDETIERNIRIVKQPVNADLLGSVFEKYFDGDETQAAEVTALVYKSREESEKEFLKLVTANKKRKVRSAEGERLGIA